MVDDPELCSFILPAIVDRGTLLEVVAPFEQIKGQRKLNPVPVVISRRQVEEFVKFFQTPLGRLAKAGFAAVAPDALSGSGGTPADEDEARRRIGELDREAALGIYLAAVRHAAVHPHGHGKVGCVGFCWGGGMSGPAPSV